MPSLVTTTIYAIYEYVEICKNCRFVLLRIARIAGVPFTAVVHRSVPEKERTFRDLVHEKALFKRVAVLWVMWFTAAICGYSIDLNSAFISGDLYLNQSLLSILIAFSKIVLVLIDTYFPRFSRRNLHQCSQLVVILCFVLLSWLVLVDHHGIGILLINVIGTVFIEFTWDACYLCAVESVPTPLRASSVGSCSLVARIGALFAPMLVFLNSFWAVSVYLAVVLLGTLNLMVSCLWLVETKGISLDSVRLAQMSAEDEADAGGMEGMKRNVERTPTGKDIEGADQALMKPQ
ncbi:hypothetical protein niasHT_025110 [Heterodera trifolii]|uniref:Uncharacterized protein n=1 Tax=Heterodera trifolii TaxID=157864 RepID=A0ABD2K1B1_9BILA